MKTKLSKIKKNELFRFVGRKKVYKYTGKERLYNSVGDYRGWGYSYVEFDDISNQQTTLTDREIEIGFTY